MSEVSEGKRYRFDFSGDFVELVIAPVPREKAEFWLTQSEEKLFVHAYGRDGTCDAKGLEFLEAVFLDGAKYMEGCELKNGTVEIRDSDGNEIDAFSLESDRLDIDDIQQIDLETHLVDDGPTLIRRACFTGEVSYQPQSAIADWDEANWYVFVTDTGREPFISSFHFGNETAWEDDVEPEADGRCRYEEVWLRVPQSDGSVRQLYYSASPEPL
jgi:hypothetical protein